MKESATSCKIDDNFDDNWRERLRDYQQTKEYKENFQRLKGEINETLPKEKPEKKLLFVFMGIPGSGKSTIAQIIKESIHPSVTLRSDWIFFQKLKDQMGNDYYKAYAYQEGLAKRYLSEGYSVIMDDNNRTVKNRNEVYKWAIANGATPILIKIDVDLEIAAGRVTLKGKETKTKEEILEDLKEPQSQIEKPTKEETKLVKIIKIDGNKSINEIKIKLTNEIKNII